jgi:hypothetical protein
MQDEDGRPKGRKRKENGVGGSQGKRKLEELAERRVDLAGGFWDGKLPTATALTQPLWRPRLTAFISEFRSVLRVTLTISSAFAKMDFIEPSRLHPKYERQTRSAESILWVVGPFSCRTTVLTAYYGLRVCSETPTVYIPR